MTSLNTGNYKTVWQDNFGSDSSLNTGLWPVKWGNGDDFSFNNGGLTLTSYASEGWSPVGFMQADYGAGYAANPFEEGPELALAVGHASLRQQDSRVWRSVNELSSPVAVQPLQTAR